MKDRNFQDVCHIFELGGGTLSTNLLETPMSPLKLESLHVVLMVDLSDPHTVMLTLNDLFRHLNQCYKVTFHPSFGSLWKP